MQKKFIGLAVLVIGLLALGASMPTVASANNGKGPPCGNDGNTTLDILFGVARMSDHLPGALINGKSGVAGANGNVSGPHQNC